MKTQQRRPFVARGVPGGCFTIALDWEARETFDTRKTWVREAVEQARRRLGGRR
jgi:hypothetical protein